MIDYLPILDQRREHPPLDVQVAMLRNFACERGLIFVAASQIDRRYNRKVEPMPMLNHIRLPNPLDLTQFDKA